MIHDYGSYQIIKSTWQHKELTSPTKGTQPSNFVVDHSLPETLIRINLEITPAPNRVKRRQVHMHNWKEILSQCR